MKADLTRRFIKQTITVNELIVRHDHPTAAERNYKDAILQLEGEGVVTVAVPGRERRHYKGGWTLPDDSMITFVRAGGGN